MKKTVGKAKRDRAVGAVLCSSVQVWAVLCGGVVAETKDVVGSIYASSARSRSLLAAWATTSGNKLTTKASKATKPM